MPLKTGFIHNFIRKAREGTKKSQTKMAESLECSQPHLCALERGKRPANIKRLRAIAKVTKCSFWIRSKGYSLLNPKETKSIEQFLEKEKGKKR